MDDFFDIKSLAIHLQKTPDQIRKLAERGSLPGRRVAGDWRFDRSEIFHWMESHIGDAGSIDLRQLELLLQPRDQTVISVRQQMNRELIWKDFPCRSKSSLIVRICQQAADAGRLWDPVAMATAIQAREEMHSTALENGVALLHPRRPMPNLFEEPFLALAIMPSGIPFGGPRGAMTDIFFLLASSDESYHLQLLARLSRLITLPNLLQAIRNCETPIAILNTIETMEDEMDGTTPKKQRN